MYSDLTFISEYYFVGGAPLTSTHWPADIAKLPEHVKHIAEETQLKQPKIALLQERHWPLLR